MQFISQWAEQTWLLLLDSSFLFIIGLLLAGILSLYVNQSTLRRLIGSGKGAAFRAALIGVPLPLCSCSVLPVASQLRKSGVSKGGTVSFLIATPETGIDSIALTWSLTDPLLTVLRPITAFLSAFSAGVIENRFEGESESIPAPAPAECDSGCGCAGSISSPPSNRLVRALKYTADELLADLAPYLLFGFALAGLLSAVLQSSPSEMAALFTSGWLPYVGAILVGLPLYVCATSSTPLAATLLAAGFSPGAVLVFLLVGPATNLVSLATLRRIIGGWSVLRYLLVLTIVSILCGLIADWLYSITGMNAAYSNAVSHHDGSWLNTASAVLLSIAVLYYSARHWFRRFKQN